MFSTVAVVILFLLGCFFMCLKVSKGGNYHGGGIVFGVCSGVWLIAAITGPYTTQISYFTEIRGINANISIYKERRDNLVAVVRTELAKYPEFEKKIMGNYQPSIILSFPLLQSNETIVKTVNDIVALEDGVYKLRSNLVRTQTDAYFNEISPWVLYVPSYQNFFGEANPVTLAR